MKTRFFLVLSMVVLSMTACGNDVVVKKSELPQQAQQFVDTYFANVAIAYITKDFNSFEVRFSNGTEIEFDKNGVWTDVDCERTAIPEGIVPQAISDYVKATFANTFIVKISREFHHFDVELNTGLDLVFDKNGAFKHIDD